VHVRALKADNVFFILVVAVGTRKLCKHPYNERHIFIFARQEDVRAGVLGALPSSTPQLIKFFAYEITIYGYADVVYVVIEGR